jgi:hypothetical protein
VGPLETGGGGDPGGIKGARTGSASLGRLATAAGILARLNTTRRVIYLHAEHM